MSILRPSRQQRARWALGLLAAVMATAGHSQVTEESPRWRSSEAGTYRVFHDFQRGGGGAAGGANPFSAVTLASNGNLYGLTQQNGKAPPLSPWSGGIYQVKPNGSVHTVHTFRRSTGYGPRGGLTATADGSLYGVTFEGGANDMGTIFRFSESGGYQVQYSFNCFSSASCYPRTRLVEGPDGSLYGTAISAAGAVFRMAPDGSVTGILPLACCSGPSADSPLTMGSDGNLYTMGNDGAYRLSPSGVLTLLHAFNPESDGTGIGTALVQASDGNFYGLLRRGGPLGGGTLFRLRPDGEFTVLHAFTAPTSCCGFVSTNLSLQASDGFLYGAVYGEEGSTDGGSIWRMSLQGKFAKVLRLSTEGGDALGAPSLTETADGRLVGVAGGGLYGDGALFVLAPAKGQGKSSTR